MVSPRSHVSATACISLVTLLFVACTGNLSEVDGFDLVGKESEPHTPRDELPIRSCNERQIDQTPARLLTRTEYNNAVADLLGDTTSPLKDSPSAQTGGFDNDAQSLSISVPMAQHYLETAQSIAERVMQDPGQVVSCGAGQSERECATAFVESFGRRAFRKPVENDERDALLGLYDKVRDSGTFNEGISMLIVATLNSPNFLYHVEQGVPQGDGTSKLTDYEVAEKLSFFLTGSIPDAQLSKAADDGLLQEAAQVRAHAERLLETTAAREHAGHMHTQWLELDTVRALTKDENLYPDFNAEVAEGLIEETTRFVEHIVWNDGTIADLFTAGFTMLDEQMASYYQVEGGMGADFVPRTHADQERTGLLTQGSIMTVQSKHGRTSPVHRGIFVRERILCETLPEAPEEIPSLDEIDPELPVRERLAQHREDAACAGCHALMDPIGFAFEAIDPVGRTRTHDELGHAVDTTGEVASTAGVETIEFASAKELSHALSADPRVESCVVEQWYEYAMSRRSDAHDSCTLEAIRSQAEDGNFRIKDIILTVVSQDTFPLSDRRWRRSLLMTPLTKTPLGRRTLLRGAGGVGLALPYLKAMEGKVHAATEKPKRLVIFYTPNGFSTLPNSMDLAGSPLDPLTRHKSRISLLQGFDLASAKADPTPLDYSHYLGWGHLLTGQNVVAQNVAGGVSFDMLLAQRIGSQTPHPYSLHGVPHDQGQSPISWNGAAAAANPEFRPDRAFSKLFSGLNVDENTQEEETKRLRKPEVAARLCRRVTLTPEVQGWK